jgi:hypothetical protein
MSRHRNFIEYLREPIGIGGCDPHYEDILQVSLETSKKPSDQPYEYESQNT